MKERHYLAEDLAQIKRYFPGAQPVTLRTPFDITPRTHRRVIVDVFHAERTPRSWAGALRWTI